MNSPKNDSQKSVSAKYKLSIIIVGSLLTVSALAWLVTYSLMPFMMQSGSMMSFGVAAIVFFPSVLSISIFEIVWIVGMIAMMFPAMIPIVLFYTRVAAKSEPNLSLARSVGTPLFLGGYLIVYAVLGMCAFAGVYAASEFSNDFAGLSFLSVLAPGGILIATGAYQFTPLKSGCLKNCISPIGFFAVHYRQGFFGSFRMGLTHGYYCVGCCWAFMIVMLAIGAMSIPAMAVLAGVIAVEKLVRGATWLNKLIGAGFILSGLLVVLFPSLLAQI